MPEPVRLTIECGPEGNVSVFGPIQDKLFCYGLLEIAKDVIRDYGAKKSPIIIPTPTIKFSPERSN
jgi:hypothetical protein